MCEGWRNAGDHKGKVLCQGVGAPTGICHRLVENVVKLGGDKQCGRAGGGLQLMVEVGGKGKESDVYSASGCGEIWMAKYSMKNKFTS